MAHLISLMNKGASSISQSYSHLRTLSNYFYLFSLSLFLCLTHMYIYGVCVRECVRERERERARKYA